jgi:hypothetical protein
MIRSAISPRLAIKTFSNMKVGIVGQALRLPLSNGRWQAMRLPYN